MVHGGRLAQDGGMDQTLLPDLHRPRDGAMVAGVCLALARRWQVDPLLVRVAALLLALSGGFGVLLYAWGWLVLPQQGHRRSLAEQFSPQVAQWSRQRLLATGLVGSLLLCLLTAPLTSWSLAPGLVLLVLVTLGRRQSHHSSGTVEALPAPTPSSEFTIAVEAWTSRLAALEQAAPVPLASPSHTSLAPVPAPTIGPTATPRPGTIHLPAPPALAAVPRPRRVRRPSWRLGLVVLALAALPFLLDPSLPVQDQRTALHALSLGVIAVSLVLAGLLRLPRPRMALPVALAVLGSALLPMPSPTSMEPVDVHWTSTAQLPTHPLEVTAQESRVDLSDLSLPATGPASRLAIHATAADLTLRLPEEPVRVDYRLNGATVDFDGGESLAGIKNGSWHSTETEDPRLVVTLHLTGANAEVDHA